MNGKWIFLVNNKRQLPSITMDYMSQQIKTIINYYDEPNKIHRLTRLNRLQWTK